MPRSGEASADGRAEGSTTTGSRAPVSPADPAGEHGAGADQGLELWLGRPPRDVQLSGVHDRGDWGRPVRVKWINELVEPNGDFRPHLLPIDQTLHWANPPGGARGRDGHGSDQAPYRGPVPIVTHLHGGHSSEESDGYPEAWYLPHARNIPPGYARTGSLYRTSSRRRRSAALGQAWTPGSAVFQYDNDQRATTMWYHDHTLGMTRANVYAGPAGFYLLRGGPGDAVAGDAPRSGAGARRPARAATTSRSRSRSRTAPSPRTARCSTRTTAPSSRASTRPSCRSRSCPTRPAAGRATSRRSGTPSSSATRSSSTAPPGRRSTCSSGATASAS